MPQYQELDAIPTLLGTLGRSLGGGLGQGINQGFGNQKESNLLANVFEDFQKRPELQNLSPAQKLQYLSSRVPGLSDQKTNTFGRAFDEEENRARGAIKAAEEAKKQRAVDDKNRARGAIKAAEEAKKQRAVDDKEYRGFRGDLVKRYDDRIKQLNELLAAAGAGTELGKSYLKQIADLNRFKGSDIKSLDERYAKDGLSSLNDFLPALDIEDSKELFADIQDEIALRYAVQSGNLIEFDKNKPLHLRLYEEAIKAAGITGDSVGPKEQLRLNEELAKRGLKPSEEFPGTEETPTGPVATKPKDKTPVMSEQEIAELERAKVEIDKQLAIQDFIRKTQDINQRLNTDPNYNVKTNIDYRFGIYSPRQ